MTVLVTGAAGLIGSHVTDVLVERGDRPRVLVRPGESLEVLPTAVVDIHRGDVADRGVLEAALRNVDCVLHCAARTGPWGSWPEYERTNVRGLEVLVRTAVATGVRRIVHVSSIVVHGTDVGGTADETAPLREEPNPYSRSKVAGERLAEHLIREHGAPVTIVRPGWVYGPRDTASFGRVVAAIARGRMIMLGSGENHLPLIYVRDVAQGIVLASEREQSAGHSYLLVNDEPVTQREFICAIASELGVPSPKLRIPYRLALAAGAAAEAAGHLAHLEQPPPLTRFGVRLLGGENRFSIARARHDLGFVPSVNLGEGVHRGVDWYRATLAGSPRHGTQTKPTDAGPRLIDEGAPSRGGVNAKAER